MKYGIQMNNRIQVYGNKLFSVSHFSNWVSYVQTAGPNLASLSRYCCIKGHFSLEAGKPEKYQPYNSGCFSRNPTTTAHSQLHKAGIYAIADKGNKKMPLWSCLSEKHFPFSSCMDASTWKSLITRRALAARKPGIWNLQHSWLWISLSRVLATNTIKMEELSNAGRRLGSC